MLAENTDAENIWQVVSSPDGRYILYVESINVGTGVTTDEEEVFYRVYSIEDGTSTTIYSGYRQFLLVDWK
jgi:Tol biopolymer transport system component